MMTSDSDASPNVPDPAVPAPPPPRCRFQFSLATLLWLTTVVVCLAALSVTYRDLQLTKRELWLLREQVRQQLQRSEMETLHISDQNNIYARGIGTKWSWRVYLPSKPQFRLCMAVNIIPVKGFPPSATTVSIQPGENVVQAFVEHCQDGPWRFNVEIVGGCRMSAGIEPLEDDLQTSGTALTLQESTDPGSRLVLLRSRKMKTIRSLPAGGNSSGQDPQPCSGVMLWIEEAK